MSGRDWFLALVTRVKHEDLYIREWLEYHLLVGVEHFFLYDMDGGQGLAGILEPYEEAGVVTRIPWTHYEGTRLDRGGPLRQNEFQIRQNDNRTRLHTREQFDDRNRQRNDVDDDGMLRFAPARAPLSVSKFLWLLKRRTFRPHQTHGNFR